MARSSTTASQENSSHFLTTVILSALAAFLLLIAASSLWFNKYIFDRTNFTSLATQSIMSQESREAIATEITDRLLQNRPILKEIVDDQAIKLISSILEADRVQKLLTRSISGLQTAITSQRPERTEVDLTTIKNTLIAAAAISSNIRGVEEGENIINPEDIPDRITLFDVARLPNIYAMGMVLNILGPLSLIAAIIALSIPIYQAYKNKKTLYQTLTIQGAVIIVGTLLGYAIGPLFRPMLLSRFQSFNVRIVIENLYNSFIAVYIDLLNYLLFAGAAFLIVAVVVWYLSKKNRI